MKGCIVLPLLLIVFQLSYSQHISDTLYSQKPLEEVVVSSSRTSEKMLHSPINIIKVSSGHFKHQSQSSFFDALENIQGVQMITPSMGFKVLNARGFSNTTNVRFSQLVDGMDVQSPHIGGPIGNSLGPNDLDIKDVEIVTGVASTLYGMNTVNGLTNFLTKSPFEYTGLSFQQKLGVNHLHDPNSSTKLFSESLVRYAGIIGERFAFKINATITQGYDWIANNQTDLNSAANSSTNLTGANNPGKDLVNVYGDESSDRKTITLAGKSYVVSRSGYPEKEVVDYSLKNIKFDIGLYYKFGKDITVSYTYHFAVLNNVYQRANRFRLQDYYIQQNAIQVQSPRFVFRAYLNNENTGNSYNLRSMAENIDRNYKTDNTWYADYSASFLNAVNNGSTVADAHAAARVTADAGRYQPGTEAFNNTLLKLQQVNNWDIGAALKVTASLIHSEAQYELIKNKNTGLRIGVDNRTYVIGSDGNYFVNPVKGEEGKSIVYSKTGAYISVNRFLYKDKLNIGFVFRVDKNDYFNVTSNPRATLVYTPNYSNTFRLAYQEGYRFPSIFEAFSNINSGGVKRVGGLPVMSNGVFENGYLVSSITAFQAAVLNDINKNGLTKTQAIIKNEQLLVKNTYSYIKPEHIKAYEAGYKAALFDGRLFIDFDIYYNFYKAFIAQTNINVPKTGVPDSIPFALNDKTQQYQYRVWTNSNSLVENYGASLGIRYKCKAGYSLIANTTFAQLKKKSNDDGLEDGFNTPDWIFNAGISSIKISKDAYASFNYRWQSKYYWQSFLVNDWVAAYGTLDANINYKLPKKPVTFKLSASNILNNYYYSFTGGPHIGGMYLLTITYEK